jgi:HTH-type transcriptional regulator, competence development regulator
MSSIAYTSKQKAGIPRFGEWLRQLREERGLPLRAVAAAAEMDQAHLSKAELCRRLLTADQVAAIAKFFKVDATEMEAHRIAEKFRMDHADNPAALQALQILNDSPLKPGKSNS